MNALPDHLLKKLEGEFIAPEGYFKRFAFSDQYYIFGYLRHKIEGEEFPVLWNRKTGKDENGDDRKNLRRVSSN